MKQALAVCLVMLVFSIGNIAAAQIKKIPYPGKYRDWTHVKSMVIQQGHPLFDSFGGIHHIYANETALKAMKVGGKDFPDGSVLVFDLLESPAQDNAITEGERKVLAVMQKDNKAFKETGGWGFAAFKGGKGDNIVKDPVKECFDCHKPQEANDYTFSRWRE